MPAIVVLEILLGIGLVQPAEEPSPPTGEWERFRLLAAPDPRDQTPELAEKLRVYIQSLTLGDLLTAAKQGCIAGEKDARLRLEWERQAAAESNALLCLETYFQVRFQADESRRERAKLVSRLMEVVAARGEPTCLRRAIIKRISYSENTQFQVALIEYALVRGGEVDKALRAIVDDQGENMELRKEAISAIKRNTEKQVRRACRADPNVSKAIQEKREHTDAPVKVNALVRSGEVVLADDTVTALEPVVERMRVNIACFARILASPHEPAPLRREARRSLESYRASAITQVDDEIDEVLRQSAE